ncbi:hypothetical protein Thena_1474 [Thermodesulfobium narugense DSM 14796]|uniref:Uncharacterized protein n=1 Tax=Thermodesulfobium narugense DSM 14796 TaxID=747365 RepID=M1E716_9BACT|nr:hypothetical protein [Thermodesulfobium narugense]AEE15086.1 hypothetical protein Thena_1474 [Thermodesulfobium narugense DSM 14796]
MELFLKYRRTDNKTKLIKFHKTIGIWNIERPYITQQNTPIHIITNIMRDMSFVERVFHAFITCGTRELVVSIPANNPRYVSNIRIL